MTDRFLYDYLLTQPVLMPQAGASASVFHQVVPKGQYLYKPGDPLGHMYVIEQGVVKIGSYTAAGERAVYDVLQPGETLGDLDYLQGGIEFFEFAKAVTSARVLALERTLFKHLIVHDPVVSEWFNRTIVRRWWKAETRLLLTRGDVEARLASLRREYDRPVMDSSGRAHNTFDLLSHQDLADLTGTTRQTIAKKMKGIVKPA